MIDTATTQVGWTREALAVLSKLVFASIIREAVPLVTQAVGVVELVG